MKVNDKNKLLEQLQVCQAILVLNGRGSLLFFFLALAHFFNLLYFNIL